MVPGTAERGTIKAAQSKPEEEKKKKNKHGQIPTSIWFTDTISNSIAYKFGCKSVKSIST